MPNVNASAELLCREAYAEHLNSFPWDIYLTQTFKRTRRDGINAARTVWHYLDDKFCASRAFIAVEPHYLDGIHLHGLIRVPEWHEKLPLAIHRYFTKAFGWNVTSVARSQGIISWYCSKYVVKENDFHYFGDKDSWNLDKCPYSGYNDDIGFQSRFG